VFKGPREPTLSGHTYSGQGIDMKGTAENVMNMAYRPYPHLYGYIW